jgi:hypothetical protein
MPQISGTLRWEQEDDFLTWLALDDETMANVELGSNTSTAVVTTQVPHGYSDGDFVIISATPGGATDYYRGTFPITVLSATSFRYVIRLPTDAPATSSVTCQKVVFQVDRWLQTQPANTTIHLGPGVFETRGGHEGWTLQNGQRIIGSGIGLTVLKLMSTGAVNTWFAAIQMSYHFNYVSHFEVADITLDCNLREEKPPPYDVLTKMALYLGYRHCRLRRVQAIDFGTRSSAECFVIASGICHPDYPDATLDCVIDDCIVEKPNPIQHGSVTCLTVHGGETIDGRKAFSHGCVIRNCYANFAMGDDLTVAPNESSQALGLDSGTANVGEWNRIFNYAIGGPYHDSFSTPDLISRGNYFHNCRNGLFQNLFPVRRSTEPMALASITRVSGSLARATVAFPSNFQLPKNVVFEVGDGILIRGAVPSQYNGDYVVTATAIVTANPPVATFDYVPAADPGTNATTPGTFQRMWQARFLCTQENHLNLWRYESVPPGAIGFQAAGDGFGPPYVFQNVLIQDDVIDEIQFPVGQQDGPVSIGVSTARNTVAMGNVAGVVFPTSGPFAGWRGLRYGDCESVRMFGNRGFDGHAMPNFNAGPGAPLNIDGEIVPVIDEATILSLI